MIATPGRALRAVVAAAALLALTACSNTDRVDPTNHDSPVGAGAAETQSPAEAVAYDPLTGPAPGTCLAMATIRDVFAPEAVDCDEPHGAEVTRLIQKSPATWHAKPNQPASAEALWDRCPGWEAAGYDGDFIGLHVGQAVVAAPEARADGVHWVACVIATYAPFTDPVPKDPKADLPLLQRTGMLADIADTDRTWIADGVRCYRLTEETVVVECAPDDDVYVHLTRSDGAKPFVSAAWQEKVARSKCEAIGYAYGDPGYGWWTWWPSTAAGVDGGQHCFVKYADFDPTRRVITDPPKDTSHGLAGVEAAFSREFNAFADRLVFDEDLMAVTTNSAPAAKQDRVLQAFHEHWAGAGTVASTGMSTLGIGMELRLQVAGFAGNACSAKLHVPLPYLGAPHAITGIKCR